MLQYGFFNSVDGDRKYNAETFNTFFEGLISSNGIFEGVGDGFVVSAPDSGRVLTIGTGKAMVNSCWVKNNAAETVTISAAHTTFGRYDMITLRWSDTNRMITLNVTDGTAASDPVKPQPKRTLSEWEIVLAYVYVPANSVNITAANIQDCRYDTGLCGVITGLIKQVDTTTLYNQYETKFKAIEAQLLAWEVEQKASFDTWYAALTDDLQVNTYIEESQATYMTKRVGTAYIDLPESLGYVDGDILDVFADGIYFVEGTDYTIELNDVENIPMLHIYTSTPEGAIITMRCLKSKIGMQ